MLLAKIQGRCHYAALEWNGTAKVVSYIDFDVTKLVLTDAVFSRERFTTVTAYPGFVTKSQLLETLFTWN